MELASLKSTATLRRLCFLLLGMVSTGLALPPPAAQSTWISVDANGVARTVTPAVTVAAGATSTVSPPPDYLTRQQTWKMMSSGQLVTSTASAPVATATGSGTSKAGAFLECQNYFGPDEPFCYPRRGSLLNPGTTYYITWDPTHFLGDPDGMIEVQANYDNLPGWAATVRAGGGFYIWEVPEDLLKTRGRSTVSVDLFVNYQADPNDSFNEVHERGPTVIVTDERMLIDDGLSHPSTNRAVVIAVPIVVVALVLALLGFCFWSWRKKGVVPGAGALAALKRRSTGSGAGGYGVRRSHSERVGGSQPRDTAAIGSGAARVPPPGGDRLPDDKLPGTDIQLTDRDSWSPTSPSSGRNVFREEIQRQSSRR